MGCYDNAPEVEPIGDDDEKRRRCERCQQSSPHDGHTWNGGTYALPYALWCPGIRARSHERTCP